MLAFYTYFLQSSIPLVYFTSSSFQKRLPFAAFEVILWKFGVFSPGTSQHLGVLGEIQTKAGSKMERGAGFE